MAFLHVDLPAQADDSTAAASVMFRLTTQLLQPTAEPGKRQPRRALQRVVPAITAPRQPYRMAVTATLADTLAPLVERPCSIVWTGLTARPRDTGRVHLESVWWTAQPPQTVIG